MWGIFHMELAKNSEHNRAGTGVSAQFCLLAMWPCEFFAGSWDSGGDRR